MEQKLAMQANKPSFRDRFTRGESEDPPPLFFLTLILLYYIRICTNMMNLELTVDNIQQRPEDPTSNSFSDHCMHAKEYVHLIKCQIFISYAEYTEYFHLGARNSGLSVMIAPNGEGCLWKFFSLQNGHVQKMNGIQAGLTLSEDSVFSL